MRLSEAIKRLERIDPQAALISVVEETKTQYEDLLRDQLSKGLTKDGANIEPAPYSKAYAKKRQKAGLQTAHIDLKFSGDFYKNMTLKVGPRFIGLGSTVDYEGAISKRYDGAEIYGLTDENMEKYRAVVGPLIQARTKAQYGA